MTRPLLIKTDKFGNIQWDKEYTAGFKTGMVVHEMADGGYMCTGRIMMDNLGVDLGDFYLMRTDSDGNLLWSKKYGGSAYELFWKAQITTDGGVIMAGSTDSYGAGDQDVYVVKVDSNGNLQWANTFGGSGGDYAHGVKQTPDGGYIIGGQKGPEGYVIKLDNNGNLQWAKTIADYRV